MTKAPAAREHAALVGLRGRRAVLRRAQQLRAVIGIGLQHVVAAPMSGGVVIDVVVGMRAQRAAEQQQRGQAQAFHLRSPSSRRWPHSSVAPNERAGSDGIHYKLETWRAISTRSTPPPYLPTP